MTIRTILVDDEKLAIQGLQLRLEPFEDVEIIDTCQNGREAIRAIKTQKPDLVFLDIQMPKMDGNSVLRHLRDDPKYKDLYIVMITAKGQEADRLHSLESGANEYVTKPYSPRKLIGRVKEILGE